MVNTQLDTKKRLTKRRNLYIYFRVYDAQDNSFFGHLVDISYDGLKLMTESPCLVGTKEKLRIEFYQAEDAADPIIVSTLCCWKQKSPNDSYYDLGFKFTNKGNLDLEKIYKLINLYSLFREVPA